PAASAAPTCAPSSTATGGSSRGPYWGTRSAARCSRSAPPPTPIRAARRAGADRGAAVGDTVHVISTLYCGHCSLCRGGNEHLCQNGGLMGFDYQGAYTELVAVPQVALKNVFVLPDGLDSVHDTCADPLSDAICGHKDLDIGLEQHVVVIGAGPVGTAHVALALAQGADLVYLLETSAGRLDLARGVLNVATVLYVHTTGIDPVQFIKDETGDGADRVIVACSNVQA